MDLPMPYLFKKSTLLLLIVFILNSCSDYFIDHNESIKLPKLYLGSNESQVKFDDKWWEEYNSDELNAFVKESLSKNLTLKIAKAEVKEARAIAKKYNADRYPNVGLSYDFDKEKTNGVVSDDSIYSLNPTYTLDLWGANYALYKSYENKYIAQQFEAKAAAMTIISEVVSTWLKIRFGQKEYDILNEQLNAYEKIVEYQTNNYTSGNSADQGILENKNKIHQYKIKAYQNIIKVNGLKYELAYLLGRSPAKDLNIKNGSLPNLVSLPKKGLSSDLLKDRPDIQSAWYTMIAAGWSEKNSKLAMLPTFKISLEFSDAAISSMLNSWSAITSTINSNVADWGRSRASVAQGEAIAEQQEVSYIDTIYKAIVEVRNELIRNEHQLMQISWFENQLKLANSEYNETKVNVENGTASPISVLFKLIDVYDDELSLMTENKNINLIRVDLYNSLGGSVWDHDKG
jgi:outer membrane protein, multidrug efflux system